ncbi:protein-L-isoaspartate(D-aspartate) O-methyltransferase [Sphingomonas sinipercae]|uniref:Protein-L-isoaspartate O-methyltransferase n=2 Tax=Sphingomonas sinipercae TaxID=2714944 RepID=A0A6G7ZR60_9SPHN|nr:protein-L-isoaspartate(D-aspartate) O-methyltransferase [Sphingomonas sinipercae]
MVQRQIADRGIEDTRILDAFREVPRELFVSIEQAARAYDDHPLPIECGQTISQPYIVALMIEAAGVKAGDRVIEVGAGSGYATAILSQIAGEVFAIERHPELADLARDRLRRLGYNNAHIAAGDGTLGWPEAAPFDAIFAAASGSHIPEPLLEQLAPGGRLVMPIGAAAAGQTLVRVTRTAEGRIVEDELCPVRFVPLIGREGWSED